MSIETSNDELLTPRDLRRDFTRQVERLRSGEVKKLVLMQGSEMVAVVLPLARYTELVDRENSTYRP